MEARAPGSQKTVIELADTSIQPAAAADNHEESGDVGEENSLQIDAEENNEQTAKSSLVANPVEAGAPGSQETAIELADTSIQPAAAAENQEGSGHVRGEIRLQIDAEGNNEQTSNSSHVANPVEPVMIRETRGKNRATVDKAVLITIFTSLAASTGSAIFSLKDSRGGSRIISFGDVLFHPRALPIVFYAIVWLTVAFTVSMVGLEYHIWSMIRGWSFWLQNFLLVGVGSFFLGYAFILKNKVPQFSVVTTTAPHHQHFCMISSYWFVWVYGLSALILIFVIIWVAAKILSTFSFRKQIIQEDEQQRPNNIAT